MLRGSTSRRDDEHAALVAAERVQHAAVTALAAMRETPPLPRARLAQAAEWLKACESLAAR